MDKACAQCGEVKPLDGAFYRSKRYSDGADTYCKACRDGRTRGRVLAKRAAQPPKPVRTEKPCGRCGEVKPLTEFHSAGGGKKASVCKPCATELHREYVSRPEVAARIREQDQNRRSGKWKRPPRRQPIADGYEVCTMCNEDKPLDEFHNHKLGRNGKDSVCRRCKAAVSRERYKNIELADRSHRSRVELRFGLRRGQYDEMLAAQGGVCAICGRPPEERKRLHVDHSHATGEVRGLLCYSCNTGLGVFADDPYRLRVAISYLERK